MSTTTQEPPAYTTHLYELWDIYDVVAGSRGNHLADTAVQRLLRQAVKDYPKAAEVALGKGRAETYLAVYKATDQHPGDVALNAACDAQGDDKIIALLNWAAQAPPEQVDQLLQATAATTMKRPATVTDSGPMSAQTTKDVQTTKDAFEAALTGKRYVPHATTNAPPNFYAAMLGADQAKKARDKR